MRRLLVGLLSVLAAGCALSSTASEPATLRVIMADDWASAPLVAEVIAAFEEDHPGVRVQLQGSPFSQIPELVDTAEELGQPYDLAHWHAFAAAASGLADPVDDLWAEFDLDAADYLPGAVLDVTWDGSRYGVPLDVNALVLMANRNLLAEAGISEEDLERVEGFAGHATTLAALESTDHAVAVTASSWAAYGWIVAGGGQLLDTADDGTAVLDERGLPTFTFDHPRTVAMVDTLAWLVDSGVAPPPLAPDLAMDAISSFAEGRAALHTSGSWDLPIARRTAQANITSDDVVVLPLPQLDPATPRTVLGGSSFFLPEGAPERELAFELALAFTELEVGLALAEQEGRLPALTAAYDAPLFASSPDLAAFVRQLEHAQVMPLIAYPEVAVAFRDGLDAALGGRVSAAEAMAGVQAAAERWLAAR
jgi:multiple sugar transport system substrate-binding protein